MAATDYFMDVNLGTATTLSSPGYTIGATSINVASTANLPSATGIIFAIDEVDADGARVSGTYNVFRGDVSSSTQISSLTYIGGDANRNYSAGATTRVYQTISSFHTNRVNDGILVHANQDGTLKDDAVTTDVITDANVTTAKIADDAVTEVKIADDSITNAKLDTTAGEPGGAWQTFTSSLTNITVGNGTEVAKYIQIGKTVHVFWQLTLGSTSSLSDGASVAPPVTKSSDISINASIGRVFLNDGSGGSYAGDWRSNGQFRWNDGSAQTSNTFPITEASGDEIALSGTYEAA